MFKNNSSRLVRALSTIRSGRTRAKEEMLSVYKETDQELHLGIPEILVPNIPK